MAGPSTKDNGDIREFDTGATRDTDQGKLDFEGFLSPLVIKRYAEYMHKHRLQSDGSLRASDNWQKGFPEEEIVKSMWRHFFDVWHIHRAGWATRPEEDDFVDLQDALCGLIFNAMALLHQRVEKEQELESSEIEYEQE